MRSIKITLLILLLIAAALSGHAQSRRGGDRGDRLNSARIGFITSKLNLTPKQAESFWPLFNEFDAKRKAIRLQMRSMRLNSDSLNEKQSLERARNFIAMRESEVKLERDYLDKFSKVLTGQQVLTIVSMDREFAKMIIDRRMGARGPQPPATPAGTGESAD